MNIEELKPNPGNPRKISEKKLKQLKKSLEEFGDLGGIVFNRRTGQLIGGHQRLMALAANGNAVEKDANGIGWVILQNGEKFAYREVDWDETKEKAANIAANKGAGEWDMEKLEDWFIDLKEKDFDLDLTMFDSDERRNFLKENMYNTGLIDEDMISENLESKCKYGDLWNVGDHILLCGDSTDLVDVTRLLGSSDVKLCFTSPPYSDQRHYNGEKNLSVIHLATFIKTSVINVKYFVINLGLSKKNNEVNCYWDDYIKQAKECGLKLLSWNVWNKQNSISLAAQTQMFALNHEWIFFFGRETFTLNKTIKTKLAGKVSHNHIRGKNDKLESRKSSIISEYKKLFTCLTLNSSKEISGHPATFPVEFAQSYIEACTDEDDLVYEPFCGSGSTLIACEKTKRKCLAMEIDPHYCDIIIKRWEEFTGKKAQRAG